MTHTGPVPAGEGPSAADRFSALGSAWADAVAQVSYVPLDRPALLTLFCGLAGRLVAELHRPGGPDRAVAAAVGAELVSRHVTTTVALERSVDVLDRLLFQGKKG